MLERIFEFIFVLIFEIIFVGVLKLFFIEVFSDEYFWGVFKGFFIVFCWKKFDCCLIEVWSNWFRGNFVDWFFWFFEFLNDWGRRLMVIIVSWEIMFIIVVLVVCCWVIVFFLIWLCVVWEISGIKVCSCEIFFCSMERCFIMVCIFWFIVDW